MAEIPLVPAPLRVEHTGGPGFSMRAGVRVHVGREPMAVSTAVVLASWIGAELGVLVAVSQERPRGTGAVVLGLTTDPADLPIPDSLPASLAAEAYRLEVAEHRVTITALDPLGLIRGVQSLTQLVRRCGAGTATVPAVVVVDRPRFGWRGLCLDLARHHVPLNQLTTVVAVMASLKLNVLHLHLTDDQGWRLAIPSRPRLTEVSGATAVGGDTGGFLTGEDYAELTAVAAAQGVTVVPEIDLPGHVNAAQHAYGEVVPGGTPAGAYQGVEVGFSRLHAELPASMPFIRDVITDVARMTPGPYVHVGGDEALTVDRGEYVTLVRGAMDAVLAAGKTPVGWQEVTAAELPADAVVQVWDPQVDEVAVAAAAANGARVVLSPASRVYLDMTYDDDAPFGQSWAGSIGLRDAYGWEPTEVVALPRDRIAGVEACLWSETVRSPRELFVLLLPRLAAIAEVAWSAPERREWPDFVARLTGLTPQWDAAGWPWYRKAL